MGEDEDVGSVVSNLSENFRYENKTTVTIFNTNARSLCPKIESLIDCFTETNTIFGIRTETWLSDGLTLDKDIDDLDLGADIGLICRNRALNARGVSHGGVALAYRNTFPAKRETLKKYLLDIKFYYINFNTREMSKL